MNQRDDGWFVCRFSSMVLLPPPPPPRHPLHIHIQKHTTRTLGSFIVCLCVVRKAHCRLAVLAYVGFFQHRSLIGSFTKL